MAGQVRVDPTECPGNPSYNHFGDRFCGKCGAAMHWECPGGHVVSLWAMFCTICGKPKP